MRLVFVFLLMGFSLSAQTPLTLHGAIAMAKQNSLVATEQKNEWAMAQQLYRLQRAKVFPLVSLTANLPGYTNSISSITQPDGSIRFTGIEQAFSNFGLHVSQPLLVTGGSFTASSMVNRFDLLSGNRNTTYSASPFVLALQQPLFRFNELKYTQQLAQMNLLLGKKKDLHQQELLSLKICELFFAALQNQVAEEQMSIAKSKTDSLLKELTQRWKAGKVSEDVLLQIQLEQLQQTGLVEQAIHKKQLAMQQLAHAIGKENLDSFSLEMGDETKQMVEELELANASSYLAYFKEQHPQAWQQSITQYEIAAEKRRSKLNALPGINLIAGYGSNQSAAVLKESYQQLLTQQNFSMGISMPLYQGGAQDAGVKMAQLKQENLALQVKQAEWMLLENISKWMQEYNEGFRAMALAAQMDSIGKRRYTISFQKFVAGKISYTEVMLARQQWFDTRQAYVTSMAKHWTAYYQLRKELLFDVKTKQKL